MAEQVDRKPSKGFPVIVLVVVVLAAGIGYWLIKKDPTAVTGPTPPPEKSTPPPVTQAPPPPPTPSPEKKAPEVIDYEKLQKDATAAESMAKRKSAFGIEKSLDFIAKPDESLKIGGLTIPMSEILDKIRLDKGDIIEKDLSTETSREQVLSERDARLKKLAEYEKRYAALAAMLKDPAVIKDKEKFDALSREYAALGETIVLYKKYLNAGESLAETRRQLEADDPEARLAARTALNLKKRDIENLEKALGIPRPPDEQAEAYGIYVVRPGDNVWNIHFKFLSEYFQHRKVSLTPRSDEPNASGQSSGVGKILKFSENMVYIFNLKERKLDVDLDLLKPLSKIVIFNMGEVLALLDPIDFQLVNNIRYDGETLWIPAEQ